MPTQLKIIAAVNRYLNDKMNIDFEFDHEGVCAGLAGIYIKAALENNEDRFFDNIDKLSTLNQENQGFESNPEMGRFIQDIETSFVPYKYNSEALQQGDYAKTLNINTIPLVNEFNLGLITDEKRWEQIIAQIARPNRSYSLFSHNHAIAFTVRNNHFELYDPNQKESHVILCKTAEELVRNIKACMGYTDSTFGLSIRAFSNPLHARCTDYPTAEELRRVAFQDPGDSGKVYNDGKRIYQASYFARYAQDKDTLLYLLKEQQIKAKKVRTFGPLFSELLCNPDVPITPETRKLLLKAIKENITWGNVTLTKQLITHYIANYSGEDEEIKLKLALKESFANLDLNIPISAVDKARNYDYFMELSSKYQIKDNPWITANFRHLKCLNNEFPSEFEQLELPEIQRQINIAAKSNQLSILEYWLNVAKRQGIDFSKFTMIYNAQVIHHINEQTLNFLCRNKIPVNPSLAGLTLMRKNKTIFTHYLNAYLSQQNKPDILEEINSTSHPKIQLESKIIGDISYFNLLIFVNKNEVIYENFQDDISSESIKKELEFAIEQNNIECCMFLKNKLLERNEDLDEKKYNDLCQAALKDYNIQKLTLLARIGFNILHNLNDIEVILLLCATHDDFTAITESFSSATNNIQCTLIENAITLNIKPLYDFFILKYPELMKDLLLLSINKNGTIIFSEKQLEQLLPLAIDDLASTSEKSRRIFINNCIINNTKISNEIVLRIMTGLNWNESQLNKLLTSALNNSNIDAVICLFDNYPQLKSADNLEEKITKLLQEAINNDRLNYILPMLNHIKDLKLNFKDLFLFCCQQGKAELADQLLNEDFTLSSDDKKNAIKLLFKDKSEKDILMSLSKGSLFKLLDLLKTSQREELLKSIRDPLHDPHLQKKPGLFGFLLLKQRIDEEALNAFTNTLDASLHTLVHEHFPATEIEILKTAITYEKWELVAQLLAKFSLSEYSKLDSELQNKINEERKIIIEKFVDSLACEYDKLDVRPRLYELIDPSSSANVLKDLALDNQDFVRNKLIQIEGRMIAENISINHTVYSKIDSLEGPCRKLVINKLLPLTTHYLIHLIKEINPGKEVLITTQNLDVAITNAQSLTDTKPTLRSKFDAVVSLYQTLSKTDASINYQGRIAKFYQDLNQHNKTITDHRDPAWKRYIANSMKVLGVALSLGFGLLACKNSENASLKFWQSKGHGFFNAVKKEVVTEPAFSEQLSYKNLL